MLQSDALRRLGARLALFAVAVLLTLSFGHMHAEDFFPETAQAAAHHEGAPATPQPVPPTHDDCAICVTMGMTASSVLPPPVPLAVPLAYSFVAFAPIVAQAVAAAPQPPFQSRGPPLV